MSFNRITIVGNLGRDPELRQTTKTKIANFSVATNSKDKTTWFRCVAFGKTAEFVQMHFYRGFPIYLEGELSMNEWTDENEKPRYTLEVVVDKVQFLPKGQGLAGDDTSLGAPRHSGGLHPDPDDDIPF